MSQYCLLWSMAVHFRSKDHSLWTLSWTVQSYSNNRRFGLKTVDIKTSRPSSRDLRFKDRPLLFDKIIKVTFCESSLLMAGRKIAADSSINLSLSFLNSNRSSIFRFFSICSFRTSVASILQQGSLLMMTTSHANNKTININRKMVILNPTLYRMGKTDRQNVELFLI